MEWPEPVIWMPRLVVLVGVGVFGVCLLIALLHVVSNPRSRALAAALLAVGLLILVGLAGLIGLTGVKLVRQPERPPGAGQPDAVGGDLWSRRSAGGPLGALISRGQASPTGPADEQIDLRISTEGPAGKSTIVQVNANRLLEAMGKAFLETMRQYAEKPAEPTRSPAAAVAAAPPSEAAAQASGARSSEPASPAAAQSNSAVPTAIRSSAIPGSQAQAQGDALEIVVTAGPFATRMECEAALDQRLQEVVDQYAALHLPGAAGSQIRLPPEELRRYLAGPPAVETVHTSLDSELGHPMVQLSAVLRFDRELRDRIGRQWAELQASRRLWYLAGGFGLLLGLMCVIYGYLKIDLATGGSHRWRLRLAAATMVVGLIAAAGLVFSRL